MTVLDRVMPVIARVLWPLAMPFFALGRARRARRYQRRKEAR